MRDEQNTNAKGDSATGLCSAFPRSMASEINAILEMLPSATIPPTEKSIGRVSINGEDLHIPSRVYFSEPSQTWLDRTSLTQKSLCACIFTRHHDGFVRQHYLKSLLPSRAAWVPPFVIQLLGEYVLEIIKQIAEHTEILNGEPYAGFIAENPVFIELTKKRIVSYWSCYYRTRFPRFRDYPGFQIADSLRLWKPSENSRIMAS